MSLKPSHLTNPLASIEQLQWNLSASDTLADDVRELVKYEAGRLINAAGILLRLPQDIIAQALVLLNRYWITPGVSMLEHDARNVSAAALYLAVKPSGYSVTPRVLLTVFEFLMAVYPDYTSALKQDAVSAPWSLSEGQYERLRSELYTIEAHLLCTLGFDIHVALPHAMCINYMQALDVFASSNPTEIAQRAFQHLNAALMSPQLLYLTYQPNVLAVAALYLAAREIGIKLPETEWWEVFDVDREDLGFVVVAYLSMPNFVSSCNEQRQHENVLLTENLRKRLEK